MGVLIISALLSVIFGKRVGAVFATGVLGVAGILISACIWLFILILYTNGFWDYHPKPDLPEYTSTLPESNGYGAGYVANQKSYYPPSTQVPTYSGSATPNYAPADGSQAAAPTNQTAAQADPPGPRIGVTLGEPTPTMRNLMNRDLTGPGTVPPTAGRLVVAVEPGSPADNAVNNLGQRFPLKPGDIIVWAGPGGHNGSWVAPTNDLPGVLNECGYNSNVGLLVYRFYNVHSPGEFMATVYPK